MAPAYPDKVSPAAVRKATRSIIFAAKKSDALGELTLRIIRRRVAEQLGLSEEVIEDKANKAIVKEAKDQALTENEEDDEGTSISPDAEISSVKPSSSKGRKRAASNHKTDEASEPAPKRKKGRRAAIESDDDDGDNDAPAPTGLLSAPNATTTIPDEVRQRSARNSGGGTGDDEEGRTRSGATSGGDGLASKRKSSGSKAHLKPKSVELIPTDDEDERKRDNKSALIGRNAEIAVEALTSSASSPTKSVSSNDHEAASAVAPAESESEMSVLIDATPVKKKKEKATKTNSSGKKGKSGPGKANDDSVQKTTRKGKTKEPLSKDEETLKKLKSFVSACGARPRWVKEFENLNTTSLQIKRVRQILTDLGMEGRPSMEKAKAIKAKRELAEELQEVQQFEKKWVHDSNSVGEAQVRNTRSKRSAAVDTGEDSEGDETVAKVQRNANAARRSIMAFLEDQGESE